MLKACSVDLASNKFRSFYIHCDTRAQKNIEIYGLKGNIIELFHTQFYRILEKLYDIWYYSKF